MTNRGQCWDSWERWECSSWVKDCIGWQYRSKVTVRGGLGWMEFTEWENLASTKTGWQAGFMNLAKVKQWWYVFSFLRVFQHWCEDCLYCFRNSMCVELSMPWDWCLRRGHDKCKIPNKGKRGHFPWGMEMWWSSILLSVQGLAYAGNGTLYESTGLYAKVCQTVNGFYSFDNCTVGSLDFRKCSHWHCSYGTAVICAGSRSSNRGGKQALTPKFC